MHPSFRLGLALALAAPLVSHADTASDVQALRQEWQSLRSAYESRIQTLETRLKAAEAALQTQPAGQAAAAREPPAAPAVAAAPAAPNIAAAPGATQSAGTGFNPSISLILSGLYTRTSRDPAGYRIAGVPLPPDAEAGSGTRGLGLGESELGLSANIDPWFMGSANLAFHPDNTVSVEEAFVQTTSLGNGLTLKAGRFLSSVGYLNSQHAHVWDFVDAPLAYQAMLGTQFADDGLQLAWLAPTDQFIEVRAELGRGRSYPGTKSARNGAGMAALSLHTGGDVGESHSWRAGLSVLQAKASDQALDAPDALGTIVSNAFSGRTRVWIADGVWKWAPGGNAARTNFKLQGEYLRSTREGNFVFDTAGVASAGAYDVTQSGWYLQGIYQFMPRWRIGLRTERIDPGTPSWGANAGLLLAEGMKPRKESVMLDWAPSEFSRVRLQLARDRSRPGAADNQFFLQYQMSLGAHGAHAF